MVEVVGGGIVRKKSDSGSGEHRLIAEISDNTELRTLNEVLILLYKEHTEAMEEECSSAYLCGVMRAIQLVEKMKGV